MRWLVRTGFLPPLLFWTTTLLCGWLLPGYDHTVRLVSELGALGTPTRYLFSTGLVLCVLFSLSFIVGLYRTVKERALSVLPVVLLLTYSLPLLGAAVFPYPLTLHSYFGLPAIGLILSPLTALAFWPNNKVPFIRLMAALTLLLMSLGFLIYAPSVMQGYHGLKQRFFHAGWTCWFLYLTVLFSSYRSRKT